jgi:hypothetical protein
MILCRLCSFLGPSHPGSEVRVMFRVAEPFGWAHFAFVPGGRRADAGAATVLYQAKWSTNDRDHQTPA